MVILVEAKFSPLAALAAEEFRPKINLRAPSATPDPAFLQWQTSGAVPPTVTDQAPSTAAAKRSCLCALVLAVEGIDVLQGGLLNEDPAGTQHVEHLHGAK